MPKQQRVGTCAGRLLRVAAARRSARHLAQLEDAVELHARLGPRRLGEASAKARSSLGPRSRASAPPSQHRVRTASCGGATRRRATGRGSRLLVPEAPQVAAGRARRAAGRVGRCSAPGSARTARARAGRAGTRPSRPSRGRPAHPLEAELVEQGEHVGRQVLLLVAAAAARRSSRSRAGRGRSRGGGRPAAGSGGATRTSAAASRGASPAGSAAGSPASATCMRRPLASTKRCVDALDVRHSGHLGGRLHCHANRDHRRYAHAAWLEAPAGRLRRGAARRGRDPPRRRLHGAGGARRG